MGELDYGERINKPLRYWVDTIVGMLNAKPTVLGVERLEEDILEIKRKTGYSDIILYVVDAYVLGEGALLEIITDNPKVNCVLVASNWNQYTGQAEDLGMENGIAVFTLSELMGAIYYNGKKFIEYQLPEKDDK